MSSEKRDLENRDKNIVVGYVNGGTGYRLRKGKLQKGDRSVWQRDKENVYFGCPKCSKILSVPRDEIRKYETGDSAVREGILYQSVWCGYRYGDAAHHLWVELEGYFGSHFMPEEEENT